MLRVFEIYFKTLIKQGSLSIEWPGGTMKLGDGTGPDLAILISDAAAFWSLLRNPVLRFGELYMDGRINVTRGSLYEVLALASRNILNSGALDWTRILDRIRASTGRFRLGNGVSRSRKNVARHYDLDSRFYRLFLDRDWQYSCAYFETPSDSLETAQLAKKRHIAAKLLLESGQSILDIGCGWGGMALYLAQFADARVRGVTLSKEQLDVARTRVATAGLGDSVSFALEDYRQTKGQFARVVSVGMLEHVGAKNYTAFFRCVADLLTDDGVALVHTIGRTLGPAATNEWVLKYVFPGGYLPALSELMPAIEAAGLFVTDIETLRLHYAETIKAWRENFANHREQVRQLYDERFCRMWDLYLCGAENGFRIEKQVNFQIQLAKKVDTVPLTRGYMAQREEDLRLLDTRPAVLSVAGQFQEARRRA